MFTTSEQEKLRRIESILDVVGTHAMEGLYPDAETRALLDQFAAGELAPEQLSAAIDRHVQKLLDSRCIHEPSSVSVSAA